MGVRDYLHQPEFNRDFRPIVNRANLYADESRQDYEGRYGGGGLGGGRPGVGGPIRNWLRNFGARWRTMNRPRVGWDPLEADLKQLGLQNTGIGTGKAGVSGPYAGYADPSKAPNYNAIGQAAPDVVASGRTPIGRAAPGMPVELGKARPYQTPMVQTAPTVLGEQPTMGKRRVPKSTRILTPQNMTPSDDAWLGAMRNYLTSRPGRLNLSTTGSANRLGARRLGVNK